MDPAFRIPLVKDMWSCDHELIHVNVYCLCEKVKGSVYFCLKCHAGFDNKACGDGQHCDENRSCISNSNEVVEGEKDDVDGGHIERHTVKAEVPSIKKDEDKMKMGVQDVSCINPVSNTSSNEGTKDKKGGGGDGGGSGVSPRNNCPLQFIPSSVYRAARNLPPIQIPSYAPKKPMAGKRPAMTENTSNKAASSPGTATAVINSSRVVSHEVKEPVQPNGRQPTNLDSVQEIQQQLQRLDVTKNAKQEEETMLKGPAEVFGAFPNLLSKPIEIYDSKTYFMLSNIEQCGKVTLVTSFDEDYMSLLDSCMDAEAFDDLTEPPKVGYYIMAKLEGTEQYYRAQVEKVNNDIVYVRFIDLGTKASFHYQTLKPAVLESFMYPVMGYEGFLAGTQDNCDLILREDFENFKQLCVWEFHAIQKVKVHGTRREFDIRHIHSGHMLNEQFNNLKIWEWESLLKTHGKEINEVELITKGTWGGRTDYFESCEILKFNKGDTFTAEFLLNTDAGTIMIMPDLSGNDAHNRTVLEAQMERYCQLVKAVNYFPTLTEVFIYFDGFSYHRCNRDVDDVITLFSLDSGESFPLPEGNDSMTFVRKMPPEFLRVPIGIIECEVKGGLNFEALYESEHERFQVRIDGVNSSNEGLTYVITILEYM